MQHELAVSAPNAYSPRGPRSTDRREFVLRQVAGFSDRFRPDFLPWLEDNFPIWQTFERLANEVWAADRRHYSSRTLWEVMRHETQLRERDGDFKLNNNR